MSLQVLKCGCIFKDGSFEKLCREHQMVLKKRAEKWDAMRERKS